MAPGRSHQRHPVGSDLLVHPRRILLASLHQASVQLRPARLLHLIPADVGAGAGERDNDWMGQGRLGRQR